MISRCPECGVATERGDDRRFYHMDDDSPECKDSDTREMKRTE
jgi:hypothetical protein